MEKLLNDEVVKMELFGADAQYMDVVKKAKELGIHHVGIKKPALIEKVNAKIEKINTGEIEAPEVEVPTFQPEAILGTPVQQEGTEKSGTPVARVKAPKWFEEEGAFPYKDGDVVEIVSGKDLIGRLVQVKQPSTKKNALKGHLIHPTTNQLQKTFLSVDFDRVELRQRDGQPVGQDQEVNEQQEEQQVI